MDEVTYHRAILPLRFSKSEPLPMMGNSYAVELKEIMVPEGYQVFQVLETTVTEATVILVS